jgi:hypothetical protein
VKQLEPVSHCSSESGEGSDEPLPVPFEKLLTAIAWVDNDLDVTFEYRDRDAFIGSIREGNPHSHAYLERLQAASLGKHVELPERRRVEQLLGAASPMQWRYVEAPTLQLDRHEWRGFHVFNVSLTSSADHLTKYVVKVLRSGDSHFDSFETALSHPFWRIEEHATLGYSLAHGLVDHLL